MPEYIEKIERLSVPVIFLRITSAFPSVTLNFDAYEQDNKNAALAAANGNGFALFICAQGDLAPYTVEKLPPVGTVCKIKQCVEAEDDSLHMVAEGFSRATLMDIQYTGRYYSAEVMCKTVFVEDNGGEYGAKLVKRALLAFERVVKYFPGLPEDVVSAIRQIDNPGLLADFMASNILIGHDDKQQVLNCFDPLKRVEVLLDLITDQLEMLEFEVDIHKKVHNRINDAQKERYLREQQRIISEELGDRDEEEEYYHRIISAKLPKEIEEKLLRENERMAKSQFGSAEASVLRNYLDVCLELPWKKQTNDRVDIGAASKILEADHDGLEKVKERILEYLAVKKLTPDLKNQIICLVGPPGTGKTSIARSIAKAMNRKYVRVSLGGVRDEADIRGHRKTYVGAMPGRIIDALTHAGVKNPLMLLDEIDKVGSDGRGDPTAALLEVLDPEQNRYFRDHFVELPFDLSDCVFICTANSLSTVPRPLIDRMEIIELSSYTRQEKLSIAKHHLVPKQAKRHGLNGNTFRVSDGAILELADHYTREAGVRNLEREIASLCRKAAMKIVLGQAKRVTVDTKDVEGYLGAPKIKPEKRSERDEIGTVNGLAYTEAGGDLLKIEVAILEGSGKLELTGSLGDVMKESAKAALSYIRSVSRELEIDREFYKKYDIHIHVPEGAVPKDGPSAGITMVTAIASALTQRPVHRDIAMTGEVTLRGNVLAIGGLREKTMAAYSAGIKRVIIPQDNVCNLEDIDPVAREALEFIPVSHASEVLSAALCAKTSKVSEPKLYQKTICEEKLSEISILENTVKGDYLGA